VSGAIFGAASLNGKPRGVSKISRRALTTLRIAL
jgi:hypothetical protein